MEYMCLECDHHWDALEVPSGYRQCPNPECRGSDVAPASFWNMVEEGRKRGISHNTRFLDIVNAFQAVWGKESLLSLGAVEFWRVIKRVIKEVENPRYRRERAHVE